MAARIAALTALVFLWAGQALAGQSDVDDPPIRFRSTDCQTAYRHYEQSMMPHYFAISEDGRFCGYTLCDSGCRKTSSPDAALRECRNIAEGQECRIYAYRGRLKPNSGVQLGGASGE